MDTGVVEYIDCNVCGTKVEIHYNWINGHYKGECPFCHKWLEGDK